MMIFTPRHLIHFLLRRRALKVTMIVISCRARNFNELWLVSRARHISCRIILEYEIFFIIWHNRFWYRDCSLWLKIIRMKIILMHSYNFKISELRKQGKITKFEYSEYLTELLLEITLTSGFWLLSFLLPKSSSSESFE